MQGRNEAQEAGRPRHQRDDQSGLIYLRAISLVAHTSFVQGRNEAQDAGNTQCIGLRGAELGGRGKDRWEARGGAGAPRHICCSCSMLPASRSQGRAGRSSSQGRRTAPHPVFDPLVQRRPRRQLCCNFPVRFLGLALVAADRPAVSDPGGVSALLLRTATPPGPKTEH